MTHSHTRAILCPQQFFVVGGYQAYNHPLGYVALEATAKSNNNVKPNLREIQFLPPICFLHCCGGGLCSQAMYSQSKKSFYCHEGEMVSNGY